MKTNQTKKNIYSVWDGLLQLINSPLIKAPVFAFASSSDKNTIRAGRRRPSGSGSGERERADAPQRERPTSGGVRPPSGTSGGTGLPGPIMGSGGSRNPLLIVAVLVILVLMAVCGGPNLLGGLVGDGGLVDSGLPPADDSYSQPLPQPTATGVIASQPTKPVIVRSTSTPRPSSGTTAGENGDSWTVMLYQDADDKVLEQDIYIDLNEAERVGSGENLNIVAQVDRYKGGYQADGDWTSTKRFYITQDFDLNRLGSREIDDIGEANMSDANTLVDFVTWAVENYPADKYALILSDHGMGWPGGWSDPDPVSRARSDTPLASAIGDHLYIMELDNALSQIRAETGIDKFELIGMDACLMGHLEVFSALEPHARYAVASQETEPALGWAYTSFLNHLKLNPGMDGGDLGQKIVDSYIIEDQRIIDDQARADFLRQGGGMSGLFGLWGGPTADQIAAQLNDGITITTVDLSKIPALMDDVNGLAFELKEVDQAGVAKARTYTQSFTSIFGNNVPPSYIDLGNFVQILAREIPRSNVSQSASNVLKSLQQAVVAEKHGPKKPGATGISIYFPNSQLYRSPATGPQSYTAIANHFSEQSLWDDYLAFHYTGRPFELANRSVVVPESSVAVRAPGTGAITVSPIALSNTVADPDNPVLLSADIQGENIGYIYLFVGYYDSTANSIFVADMDYLESPETREIEGVYYPVWGDGEEFTLEFEWEPLMFSISNGQEKTVALLHPRSYGANPEQAVYTVDGIYNFADGSEYRYARLYFSDGSLRQVFGFTGEEFTGSPREIIPQPGDQFTILERWLDLDSSGQVTQVVNQEGNSLTFADQTFTWEEMWAAQGQYIVGYMIEDLDGNLYQSYGQIRVD